MKNNLYETFSDKWIHNSGTIWLYSDPHFGDEEIYKIRFPNKCDSQSAGGCEHCSGNALNCPKFPLDEESTKILDNMQIKRINSKVGKNDTIIFLGDIGDLEYIKKIKGYKVLIMGNHEKGASNYLMGWDAKWWPDYDIEELKKGGYTEVLDYPPGAILYGKRINKGLFDEVYEGPLMVNDRLILSHEPIEGLPKYMFNIHGHDHANKFSSSRHLNVCAENIDYTPVNLLSLLKTGLLKDVENIHRACIDKATKEKRKKELLNIDRKLKELYKFNDKN